MGTYTDFTGAIRITPCLKEPLAGRFRQFLGIRHMKRDVKILEALFPTLEERKAVTLFGDGDFGEDGAFFLPIHTRDLTRRICLHERYAEGLTDERDMNMTPGPCPSLYCDLELRNDPDNGHSYLGWNEAEKAYYITDWIGYIAEWLSKLGYHLDGKMFAVVEGGMSYYTITVDGDKVTSEEFIPDATYVDEFYACEESEDILGASSWKTAALSKRKLRREAPISSRAPTKSSALCMSTSTIWTSSILSTARHDSLSRGS